MSKTPLSPLDPALCVRVAPYDDLNWIVLEPYRYVSRSVRAGLEIVVPAGFVSDGASVPRYFWRVIPPFGRHFNAAVVHDYLYRQQQHGLTRSECDIIFFEIMTRDGVSRGRMRAMYRALQKVGGIAWRDGKAALLASVPEGAADLPGADPDEVANMLGLGEQAQLGEGRA